MVVAKTFFQDGTVVSFVGVWPKFLFAAGRNSSEISSFLPDPKLT